MITGAQCSAHRAREAQLAPLRSHAAAARGTPRLARARRPGARARASGSVGASEFVPGRARSVRGATHAATAHGVAQLRRAIRIPRYWTSASSC